MESEHKATGETGLAEELWKLIQPYKEALLERQSGMKIPDTQLIAKISGLVAAARRVQILDELTYRQGDYGTPEYDRHRVEALEASLKEKNDDSGTQSV